MSCIVAVDLGYGHVKVETRSQAGALVRDCFPSFVALGSDGGSAALESFARLDLLSVQVNQRSYVVGKDSVPRQTIERNREAAYSQTDAYMALMLGALWHARREVIDVLVVGLPMNTLRTYSKLLKQRLVGRHVIPDFRCGNRGDGRADISVEVRAVVVLGQPVGAFLAACESKPELREETSLIVDMGFNTLDILGMENMKPRPDRIDAFQGGVAGYIDELIKSINSDMKAKFPGIHAELNLSSAKVEQALRDKNAIKTGLGPVNIANHSRQADALLDAYMERLATKLGSYGDISLAVLAGGGATLIERAYRRKFPLTRNVLIAPDPQFSIVHGFLLYAEDKLREAANV
jgi:PRTRC genetic system protein D